MGLVNVPLVVADEPGSWEIGGGQLMWDALTGAHRVSRVQSVEDNHHWDACALRDYGRRTFLVGLNRTTAVTGQYVCHGETGKLGDVGPMVNHPQGEPIDRHRRQVPGQVARGKRRGKDGWAVKG